MTEIKYKLPSINEEVTKMFTSLQGNIDSVNKKCQHVEDTKRKHVQKVNGVDQHTSQFISDVQSCTVNRWSASPSHMQSKLDTTKQQILQELYQIVDGIKQNYIVKSQPSDNEISRMVEVIRREKILRF